MLKKVCSYIEKLFKGKGEARLVVCGSFGLHMHDGLLEDLLVTNVSLDQSPEAGNHGIGFLVKLGAETQNSVHHSFSKEQKIILHPTMVGLL